MIASGEGLDEGLDTDAGCGSSWTSRSLAAAVPRRTDRWWSACCSLELRGRLEELVDEQDAAAGVR